MALLKKRLSCIIMAAAVICAFLLLNRFSFEINGTGDKPTVVSTTTMLYDLTRQIGGDKINALGLMGSGIDPHQYRASAGDVIKMQQADMVVYNGLHLEGKMGDIFESLAVRGKKSVCVSGEIAEDRLIINDGIPDPHIWFDVSLWKEAAKAVEKGLAELDTENAWYYGERLERYIKELEKLDIYIRERVGEIPEKKRVLITAHDAFGYFGRAYGFEVTGLQGINTATEAAASDVSRLADIIAEREINAVFVESSMPVKNIKSLMEAVNARGYDTDLGGSLYSDSIGDEAEGTDTYISAFRHNIDTIANELKD